MYKLTIRAKRDKRKAKKKCSRQEFHTLMISAAAG
jgi:hypothetical protein